MNKNYLILLIAVAITLSASAQNVTFSNVSVSGGSGNIGVVDLNGDFLDDLLDPSSSNLLIQHQTESGFDLSNISISVSNNPSWSIASGDFDANGINDIIFGGGSGVSFLQANDDGSSYTQSNDSNIFIFSQRTNFIDIDNDGNLDAFICHDVQPNVYYINDGNGNFPNVIQGGLGDTPTGHNYGSLWFDYDNDGDMDLHLSKCVVGSQNTSDSRRNNQLHRNNGDGTFTEVAAEAGINTNTQSWSSAVGDFDNDGDMDLIVADQHVNEIGTKFFINNGDGTFDDITAGSVWESQDGAIDIVTFDFNNDGYLDIYSELDTRLLMNNGDMTFTANPSQIPGGGAVGDLNNDGFLDVYTSGNVRMNNGNNNNWFKLNLVGTQSNINAIGAIITIEGDFGTQIRNVRSGEGFNNMHSLNPHFGLGTATIIDQLTIQWPSGLIETSNDVDVNQTLFVQEGSTLSIDDNPISTLIDIFPNPATNEISISAGNTPLKSQAIIYDVLGKSIPVTIENNNVINISQLAMGIYYLELVTNQDEKIVQKFIKN